MSIICMTCEQLSQCNLLSTVSLQSISCLYRFCLEKKRNSRNEFGRKEETNIFCHGPHLTFLLNLRRIFTKIHLFCQISNFRQNRHHFRCCVNFCTYLDTFFGNTTYTFTWVTYPAPPYVVSLAQKGYPFSWVLFWYRHGMSSHDILVSYFVMFHPGV